MVKNFFFSVLHIIFTFNHSDQEKENCKRLNNETSDETCVKINDYDVTINDVRRNNRMFRRSQSKQGCRKNSYPYQGYLDVKTKRNFWQRFLFHI